MQTLPALSASGGGWGVVSSDHLQAVSAASAVARGDRGPPNTGGGVGHNSLLPPLLLPSRQEASHHTGMTGMGLLVAATAAGLNPSALLCWSPPAHPERPPGGRQQGQEPQAPQWAACILPCPPWAPFSFAPAMPPSGGGRGERAGQGMCPTFPF